mmetsp:Transcript_84123/g.132451  ORF Transcript_84123/g.132451 Transcript_84123/m.132451 type:complete len:95 (+) Transcript_84123:495-779(+)
MEPTIRRFYLIWLRVSSIDENRGSRADQGGTILSCVGCTFDGYNVSFFWATCRDDLHVGKVSVIRAQTSGGMNTRLSNCNCGTKFKKRCGKGLS